MSDTAVEHVSDTGQLDGKAAVEAMIKVVEDYVRERRRPGGGYDLPEGLVLEMHPLVRRLIMINWTPAVDAFIRGVVQNTGHDLPFPAEIPVKVNPDLPAGTWQLAVITAEVIRGGRMSGA